MKRFATSAVVLATLFLVACDGSKPPSADAVARYVERSIPGTELRRESRVRLGRFTFALARGAMKLVAADDRETRRALSRVRRVDIASYEVVTPDTAETGPAGPGIDELRIPAQLEKALEAQGWSAMVRTRELDSQTWIYLRHDEDGSIRNLYIVELDAWELTVIDLAGKLDRLVAEAVADDTDAFVGALSS